jgi:hypothetical protein
MECHPHSYGLGLSAIRAAAAGHALVLDDAAKEHPAVYAGVGALEAGVVRLYGVVVLLGSGWVHVGCARLCGVHSVPPFSVGRAPRISAPAGPLSVVMGAKRPRQGLLSVRAAAARQHFQTLDFLPHGFVEDGVGQEYQPVRAGVGVVVLTGFPWTKYARLFGVHSL